jgi:hypothetical protein
VGSLEEDACRPLTETTIDRGGYRSSRVLSASNSRIALFRRLRARCSNRISRPNCAELLSKAAANFPSSVSGGAREATSSCANSRISGEATCMRRSRLGVSPRGGFGASIAGLKRAS